MDEFREQAPKPEALKERPEKWAREIPVEVFGTEEERKQNFNRLLQEIEEERETRGISEEEFEKKLEKAKEFVEKMPLIHTTSLKSVAAIFRSEEIISLAELEKKRGRKGVETHTHRNDQAANLDRFVFLTTPLNLKKFFSSEVWLKINNDLLDRSDVVVTAEDIAEVPERLFPEQQSYDYELWTEPLSPEFFTQVLKEYKSQAISGADFKEFLSHLIALYYQNPEDCLKDYREIAEEYTSSVREGQQELPLKRWFIPEIKIMQKIGAEKVRRILVTSSNSKELLVKNGIPEEQIQSEVFLSPRVLYELT